MSLKTVILPVITEFDFYIEHQKLQLNGWAQLMHHATTVLTVLTYFLRQEEVEKHHLPATDSESKACILKNTHLLAIIGLINK